MSSLSLFAILISAISLLISLFSFLRDSAKAKIVVFRDAFVIGQKVNVKIASINVTNVGRRPLTIAHVAYRPLWKYGKTAIFPQNSQKQNPHTLNEGAYTSYIIDKSNALESGSWKNIAYVFIEDTTGKHYKAKIAPFPLYQIHRSIEYLMSMYWKVKRYFNLEWEE